MIPLFGTSFHILARPKARVNGYREKQETLQELYGVDVSPSTLSAITDKVWELVESWQSHPLASIYPIIYLDAIHIKMRRDGKVENTAVYVVLGVDLEGHRDILGYWVGDGAAKVPISPVGHRDDEAELDQ